MPERSRGGLKSFGDPADYRNVHPQPNGTVLLVEDEAPVREFIRRTLEFAGYKVIEAQNPNEALKTLELLMARYPRIRILFMSGNAEIVDLLHRARDVRGVMLSKPFTPTVLIERVSQALHPRAA